MSTIILEEHAASIFSVDINLSKEERGPSIGRDVGTGTVSNQIGHSGTDKKGYTDAKYKRKEEGV
jgi:hypothetical protein